MARNKPSLYLFSVLLFMLLLPAGSIAIQCMNDKLPLGWPLIGKWLVFWAIGVRLFIAGLRQVTKPAFTAKEIFKMTGEESYVVIRELGLANISIGTLGIISMFRPDWRPAAAIVGGLYFGFAGILHLFKTPDSKNEAIALVSDLYIFVIMIVYLVFTL